MPLAKWLYSVRIVYVCISATALFIGLASYHILFHRCLLLLLILYHHLLIDCCCLYRPKAHKSKALTVRFVASFKGLFLELSCNTLMGPSYQIFQCMHPEPTGNLSAT